MKNYFFDRDAEDLLYTDLAIERRRADTDADGVEYKRAECPCGVWECIRITSPEGEKSIGRPIGSYDTLNTGKMDLLSEEGILDAIDAVARKLCERIDSLGVYPKRILVAGLGNKNLTPDAIGPRAIENVNPTLQIALCDKVGFKDLECSEIATVCPGVLAQTGMESADIIGGVSQKITPDVIIAVDSIATSSTERLGSTVQISDTGFTPGSGVGNLRRAICKREFGVPVISIGVPTVIDSRVFGSRESMMVIPKDIDEITSVAARIIGGAINQAFGIYPFC